MPRDSFAVGRLGVKGCLLIDTDFLDKTYLAVNVPRDWREREVVGRCGGRVLFVCVWVSRLEVRFLSCFIP